MISYKNTLVLFLLLAGAMHAFESNSSRITALEEKVQELSLLLETGPNQGCSPKVDGYGVQLGIDLLYWHPKVDGTAFAYTNDAATTALPIKGNTVDVDLHWEWGMRFSAAKFI